MVWFLLEKPNVTAFVMDLMELPRSLQHGVWCLVAPASAVKPKVLKRLLSQEVTPKEGNDRRLSLWLLMGEEPS